MSFSAASTCSRDPVGSGNGIVISFFFVGKKISLATEESIAFFVDRLWFIEKNKKVGISRFYFSIFAFIKYMYFLLQYNSTKLENNLQFKIIFLLYF